MARRLFAGVAVAAAPALREVLAQLQRGLRRERIRWVRLENLHLTLEFFGFVEEEQIPALSGALAPAAAGTQPFPLHIGGPGTFGPPRHPRVLWLGIESPGLQALHARLAAALPVAGWKPEAREFAPHLTLGRLDRLQEGEKFQAELARIPAGTLDTQTVQELILYESAAGRYVPLARWPLARWPLA